MAIINNTSLSIRIAEELAKQGYRIFNKSNVINVVKDFVINHEEIDKYLKELLNSQQIIQLRNGLYALAPSLLDGSTVSEFEIAMALVQPSAISYSSALFLHKLTNNISSTIHLITPTTSTIYNKDKSKIGLAKRNISIFGINYSYTTVEDELYYGIETVLYENAQINITDLERTLIDLINKPNFCGGFEEVINVFKAAIHKLNFNKLKEYSDKYGSATKRKVGWILEHISVDEKLIRPYRQEFVSYVRLDASRVMFGKYNKEWGIIQNI